MSIDQPQSPAAMLASLSMAGQPPLPQRQMSRFSQKQALTPPVGPTPTGKVRYENSQPAQAIVSVGEIFSGITGGDRLKAPLKPPMVMQGQRPGPM